METYGTITPKFQVHLPVKIRKKAGIKQHGRVKIAAQKGKIIITPEKNDIMKWAGKYKIKNPIPVEKIRDFIDYSDL